MRPRARRTARRDATQIAEGAMADLKSEFEAAAAASKTLSTRPDNDTMLKLYALFKQATSGDVTGDRPGGFDFVGAAKYDAWAKVKGTAKDAAMRSYIDLVNSLEG
jgi:acyl-CoA-binding protein